MAALSCFGLATNLLTSADLQSRPKLTKLTGFRERPLGLGTPHRALIEDEHFYLMGRDKQRRPWRLRLPDASHGGWRGTGVEDATYYFHGYTGGTGSAPSTWILALSFDDAGLPVPFYFYTQGSIEDLVNLDGKGPQLLQLDYWGNIMRDPGRHGSHLFPAFEKWPVRWRDRPAILVSPPESKESPFDRSNDPAAGIATTNLVPRQNRTRPANLGRHSRGPIHLESQRQISGRLLPDLAPDLLQYRKHQIILRHKQAPLRSPLRRDPPQRSP